MFRFVGLFLLFFQLLQVHCSEDPFQVFRDQVQNGGHVVLHQDIWVESMIVVSTSVFIDGNGFTLYGNHTFRHFLVLSEVEFTIENLQIEDGRAPVIDINCVQYMSMKDECKKTYYPNEWAPVFSTRTQYGSQYRLGNQCSQTSSTCVDCSTCYMTCSSCAFQCEACEDACEGCVRLINEFPFRHTGGAILTAGNVTLTNVSFRNNFARWGGAISQMNGFLNLRNCSFQNNFLSSGTDVSHEVQGGTVIYATQGNLNIENSLFQNNIPAGYCLDSEDMCRYVEERIGVWKDASDCDCIQDSVKGGGSNMEWCKE